MKTACVAPMRAAVMSLDSFVEFQPVQYRYYLVMARALPPPRQPSGAFISDVCPALQQVRFACLEPIATTIEHAYSSNARSYFLQQFGARPLSIQWDERQRCLERDRNFRRVEGDRGLKSSSCRVFISRKRWGFSE
jgi:hypothetical protein